MIAVAIIVVIAVITFGGIKSVTKFSDAVVPVMAGLYVLIVLVLIVLNIGKVPGFFAAVFVDTIVICSLAGFVVTAGAIWNNPSIDWDVMKANKIGTFLTSVKELVPGDGILDVIVFIIVVVAFGLFAFTTLLCDLTYTEIAANKISKNKKFIYFTRCLGALIFVPLGTLTVLSGLQLDNLWYVSDLINVILIFVNIPTLLVGRKLVTKAYENYKKNPGRRFVASDIGVESEVWTAEAAKENR